MNIFKNIIVKLLKKFDYKLVKIPNYKKIKVDKNEIKELHKDLNKIIQNNNFKYSKPKDLKKYLSKERIFYYHKLIEVCRNHDIGFEDKVIGDFGTCTGYLLRLINKECSKCKLIGYDISPDYVEAATNLCPQAEIYHKSILEIEKKHDLIFCSDVLEHFTKPVEALNKFLDNLEKNGILFIVVPNGRADTLEAENGSIEGVAFSGHINFWSPESWKIFLNSNLPKYKIIDGEMGKSLFAIIYKN